MAAQITVGLLKNQGFDVLSECAMGASQLPRQNVCFTQSTLYFRNQRTKDFLPHLLYIYMSLGEVFFALEKTKLIEEVDRAQRTSS